MSNPSQRKPGEEELGFSRLRRSQSDDLSKRSSKEGTTIDPLKRKSKELEASADRSEFKENVDSHSKRRKLESRESSNEDIQERLSTNRTRFDKLRNELGSTTDRLRRPQEFEDIQNRLSANRARLDNIKRAD